MSMHYAWRVYFAVHRKVGVQNPPHMRKHTEDQSKEYPQCQQASRTHAGRNDHMGLKVRF